MASEVDICNLALTHIRAQPDVISIDPAEGGVKAEQCALYYHKARQYVLRAHVWGFATTYRSLAQLALDPSAASLFTYSYAMPADCLRAIYVFDGASRDPQPFERVVDANGAQCLYTDVASATLKYVQDIEDPTKFDSQFVIALSYYLAYMLAIPVSGLPDLASENYERYLVEISRASATNANETRGLRRRSPAAWISAR